MIQVGRRVAVVMHRWVGYLHGVQRGIAEYVEQKPEWMCQHLLPEPTQLQQLVDSKVPLHGVIAYVESQYIPALLATKVPVVDVSNWILAPFPQVVPDDLAIGKMAAEYLADLGLRHFAFFGYAHASFSQLRQKAFTEVLHAAGHKVSVWKEPETPEVDPSVPVGISPSILRWLRELPKPVGLLCTNDVSGADVLDICRHAEIHVPEEICVLGVDNDELLTRISHPPLSSITLHTEKIGFEAARLLDAMMSGAPAPAEPILLPPIGVVSRQSTNLLSIADDDVLTVIRHIRDNVHRNLSVDDLLRVAPVNRRFLERRFRQHLGRSPLQEIRRVRLEKAKELLSGTDLSMPAIAKRSGFPNPERLANVFRSMTGMTPTEYRQKFRLHDA